MQFSAWRDNGLLHTINHHLVAEDWEGDIGNAESRFPKYAPGLNERPFPRPFWQRFF